jgi:hypothetical protein
MKVAELIEQLQRMPPDLEVLTECPLSLMIIEGVSVAQGEWVAPGTLDRVPQPSQQRPWLPIQRSSSWSARSRRTRSACRRCQ